MKNYFNALNERERYLVLIGGFFLLLYLYYALLYAPLSNSREQSTNQLKEKIETLNWMQHISKEAHTAKSKKSVDNSQLLTIISDELKKNQEIKFPYQLQQIGLGDIQLSFETVPFKLFIIWLDKMRKNYSIIIKQLDVDPRKTSGLVRVMLIVTTP